MTTATPYADAATRRLQINDGPYAYATHAVNRPCRHNCPPQQYKNTVTGAFVRLTYDDARNRNTRIQACGRADIDGLYSRPACPLTRRAQGFDN